MYRLQVLCPTSRVEMRTCFTHVNPTTPATRPPCVCPSVDIFPPIMMYPSRIWLGWTIRRWIYIRYMNQPTTYVHDPRPSVLGSVNSGISSGTCLIDVISHVRSIGGSAGGEITPWLRSKSLWEMPLHRLGRFYTYDYSYKQHKWIYNENTNILRNQDRNLMKFQFLVDHPSSGIDLEPVWARGKVAL